MILCRDASGVIVRLFSEEGFYWWEAAWLAAVWCSPEEAIPMVEQISVPDDWRGLMRFPVKLEHLETLEQTDELREVAMRIMLGIGAPE